MDDLPEWAKSLYCLRLPNIQIDVNQVLLDILTPEEKRKFLFGERRSSLRTVLEAYQTLRSVEEEGPPLTELARRILPKEAKISIEIKYPREEVLSVLDSDRLKEVTLLLKERVSSLYRRSLEYLESLLWEDLRRIFSMSGVALPPLDSLGEEEDIDRVLLRALAEGNSDLLIIEGLNFERERTIPMLFFFIPGSGKVQRKKVRFSYGRVYPPTPPNSMRIMLDTLFLERIIGRLLGITGLVLKDVRDKKSFVFSGPGMGSAGTQLYMVDLSSMNIYPIKTEKRSNGLISG